MPATAPLKVLLDTQILSHAVVYRTTWTDTGKSMWGPHEVDTGYISQSPASPKIATDTIALNMSYLASIAQLTRQGGLQLFTSGELQSERNRQPGRWFGASGYMDKSLLDGITIRRIDGMPDSDGWRDSKTQQRARLDSSVAHPYRALVTLLGPKNSQDAWHIHTAEIHGFFCFLTMDFKLLKNVSGRTNQEPLCSLNTRVMSPEDLAKHLGLRPIDLQ